MRTVEDESLVDHLSKEANSLRSLAAQWRPSSSFGTEENSLTGIGIPDPLVENQGADEIDPVLYLSQYRIGQKVINRNPVGVNRYTRPEVQAW